MSSGNPFRRSTAQTPAYSESDIDRTDDDAHARFPDVEQISSPKAPTRTKRVRITSPPRSPPHPSSPIASKSDHVGSNPPFSPPPASREPFEASSDDTSSDASNEGLAREVGVEGLMRTTRRNSGTMDEPKTQTKAPANPFQKTLATMEPSSGKGGVEREQPEGQEHKAGEGAVRNTLDVDSFTKMLMTGTINPSASTSSSSQPKPPANPSGDSSSSTDTSSVSRASLFEQMQEPHPESPRTSYELSVSDDDEGSSLMGNAPKKEKKKPPPPMHKHGKLVSPRGPQTVSFNDFAPSFEQKAGPISPARDSRPLPPAPRPRTSSDLNKPLPPPPVTATPDTISLSDESVAVVKPSSPDSTERPQSEQSVAQKKAPPPPPTTRRHSQLRNSTSATGNRSRSNSSLTTSSQQGNVEAQQPSSSSYPPSLTESTGTSTSIKPPPPPPTRRANASIRTSGNDDGPPPSPGLSRNPSVKSPPAPPPARNRSASQKSNSSQSGQQGIMSPPPAPPPSRRRSSGKGSLDLARSSLETTRASPEGSRRSSADIVRTSSELRRRSVNSISSLRGEGPIDEEKDEEDGDAEQRARAAAASDKAGVEPANKGAAGNEKQEKPRRDILSDMDAFQKEIDALREEYERHKREASN